MISTLKNKIYDILNDASNPYSRGINGSICFLIIISTAIVPLHLLPQVSASSLFWLLFIEKIIITIFSIEYILRIWTEEKPARYIFSWWGLVDLLSILPFYLAKFSMISQENVIILIAIRILRIFKMGKIQGISRGNRESILKNLNFALLNKETIDTVVQKHPVVYLGMLLLSISFVSFGILSWIFITSINPVLGIAVTIFFLLFATIFFIKLWQDYHQDLIYITNYRVILQNRELFGSDINEIPLESITNVKPSDTSFFHWVFKYGDIYIDTASSEGTLIFKYAKKARESVDLISKNRNKHLEKNDFQHRVPKRKKPI